MRKETKLYIGLWGIWLVSMLLQFYYTQYPIFRYMENGLFIVILIVTIIRTIKKNK